MAWHDDHFTYLRTGMMAGPQNVPHKILHAYVNDHCKGHS